MGNGHLSCAMKAELPHHAQCMPRSTEDTTDMRVMEFRIGDIVT
jgi:hypothetical protein